MKRFFYILVKFFAFLISSFLYKAFRFETRAARLRRVTRFQRELDTEHFLRYNWMGVSRQYSC